MVKLLRNDLSTVPHLDHGWFGLRSRIPNEAHITDAERDERESAEFMKKDWQEVAKDRTGIQALMQYVDKERRAQIQSSIPHIIAEIRQKLRECNSDLSRMGEARDNPKAQRFFAFQFCNEMQHMAEATLKGQYQVVPSEDPRIMLRYEIQLRLDQFHKEMADKTTMQHRFFDYEQELIAISSKDPKKWDELMSNSSGGLYAEIYKEAKISEGRNLPGTVHPDVEEKIFRKQSAHWGGIASRFVDDVKDLVKNCHDVLIRIAIPNSKVRLEVSRIMAKELEEWHKHADTALSELLEDNQARPLVTHNPKFLADTLDADQNRGKILLGKISSKGSSTEHDQNGDVKHSGKGNGDHSRFISTNLSQVLLVRARLESYYNIALYRFIDNVAMQVVERHILGPRCPMLTVSVETFARLDDEEIGVIAGEDQSDARMRARLERLQSRYTKALEKWEKLRIL